MHILLVTDAWAPQVNGVVTTLRHTILAAEKLGHTVEVIAPTQFVTLPCPGYAEFRLALNALPRMRRLIRASAADSLHIVSECPLGWAARRVCVEDGLAFTTSFHTRFPDYIAARLPVPPDLTYRVLRRFHAPSSRVLVATQSLATELGQRGFENLALWPRGVDVDGFHPRMSGQPGHNPRPVMLYAGRVALEKNIEAFLRLDLPGIKVVVGDGPQLKALKARYPRVQFTGALHGDRLAQAYASADVLVFPSRTDTFGLVMLEAMACGTPVAAFDVPGPRDVVTPETGALGDDLSQAIRSALTRDRAAVRRHAETQSWQAATEAFLGNLVPMRS